MGFPDWGDVPTWAGAAAASAAFVAAYRLFSVESLRDKRTEDRLEQEQANLVTAWVFEDGDRPGAWTVTVQNASTACVYHLVVFFASDGGMHGLNVIDLVPPTERVTRPVPQEAVHKYEFDRAEIAGEGRLPGRLRAGLTFRDSANRSWVRQPNGELRSGDHGPVQWGPEFG